MINAKMPPLTARGDKSLLLDIYIYILTNGKNQMFFIDILLILPLSVKLLILQAILLNQGFLTCFYLLRLFIYLLPISRACFQNLLKISSLAMAYNGKALILVECPELS